MAAGEPQGADRGQGADRPSAAARGRDVRVLHRRSLERISEIVAAVPGDGWRQPTPCVGWDAHDLLNHLVAENRWVPPILAGATIAEVGDAFDGDLVGDDPRTAWEESAAAAAAASGAVALDAVVHLSFGDASAEEYLWQLTTDVLVHGWDLARATASDIELDAELVDACSRWFDSAEEAYRQAGVIGPAVDVAADAPAADQLISRFGRDPSPHEPLAVIARFNAAFGARDLDRLADLITEDCSFVDTSPPDGRVHAGRKAVLRAFGELFASNPSASFETEGAFLAGDRATYLWCYRWIEGGGGHVHGVDVLRVRDGRVAEKLSYVKG